MIVVTVSTQRSGTKMLAQCFKAGTVVTPFGEVFNPDVPRAGSFFQFMEARGRGLVPQGNDVVLSEFFGELEYISGVAAVDLMFNQLEIPTVTWNTHDCSGIYGFLRTSGAVVISLERDPLECFVSMKYLEAVPGSAHVFRQSETLGEAPSKLSLSENEYEIFAAKLGRDRAALHAAMATYPYFHVLPFAEMDDTQSVPDSLRHLICRAAAAQGIEASAERIQLHEPLIYSSGINYAEVFTNFLEMKERQNRQTRITRISRRPAVSAKGQKNRPVRVPNKAARRKGQ